MRKCKLLKLARRAGLLKRAVAKKMALKGVASSLDGYFNAEDAERLLRLGWLRLTLTYYRPISSGRLGLGGIK